MEKYHLLTDRELVSRCLSGDAGAWEALINCYKRLIYSLPFKFGLSPEEATDVFQAVCVILLEKLHTLRDESMLSGWIITTASRECSKMRRLRGREPLHVEDMGEVVAGLTSEQDEAPEQAVLKLEKEQLLHRGLEMIDEKCRQLIYYLYFEEDASYRRVSQQLHLTPQSVSPTRARCLQRLRRILRKLGLR